MSKSNNKIFKIGIDFSLTSSAIFILNEETNDYNIHTIISSSKQITKKSQDFLKETETIIHNIENCRTFKYDNDFESFQCRANICKIFESIILPYKNQIKRLNIENYSFNSYSNSQIQIVSQSALIRNMLVENDIRYNIVAPNSLKSFVRYYHPVQNSTYKPHSKHQIIEAFINHSPINFINSDVIYNSLTDFLKTKNINAPIPDIIDAYYLALFNPEKYKEMKEKEAEEKLNLTQ